MNEVIGDDTEQANLILGLAGSQRSDLETSFTVVSSTSITSSAVSGAAG